MSDGGKGYKEKNKASIGHKECQSMQTAMERDFQFSRSTEAEPRK